MWLISHESQALRRNKGRQIPTMHWRLGWEFPCDCSRRGRAPAFPDFDCGALDRSQFALSLPIERDFHKDAVGQFAFDEVNHAAFGESLECFGRLRFGGPWS